MTARDQIMQVRLTADEREAIAAAASRAGMTTGEWVRTLACAVAGSSGLEGDLRAARKAAKAIEGRK